MGVLDFLPGIVKGILDTFGTDVTIEDRSGNSEVVKARVEDFDLDALESGIVKAGDLQVLVPADSLANEPETGGFATVDGKPLNIVSVRSTYATDDIALYQLHCSG